MNPSELKFKMTVKGTISLRDKGIRTLIKEYNNYKKQLIPQVQEAVRNVIKNRNIKVYAQQKWMIDKKLRQYLKNLPFHPMPFHNQSVWIEDTKEGFYIHLKTKQEEGEAVCYLKIPPKYRNQIKKACGKDNPFLGQVELIEDAKGWINCHITIRLPKREPYEPKGWVGVDVGWRKLATTIIATSNSPIKFMQPTIHAKNFKTRIIQLKHLLKEYARKGKAIKKWKNRLKNTVKYTIGVVAKEIVSKAKNNRMGVAMENLTFQSHTKRYLIPRYKLKMAVKTLCEKEGVPLLFVPARNTSLLCPKCNNRKSWELAMQQSKDEKEAKKNFQKRIRKNRNKSRFKCVDCGYQADADIVGAMNVAVKAITKYKNLNPKKSKESPHTQPKGDFYRL